MRYIMTAVLLTLLPVAAVAAPEPLQPAPVPTVGDGHVTPADRAGEFNGSTLSAPFSAAPTNEVAGSGQASQQNEQSTTRQSAPSPNLSK